MELRGKASGADVDVTDITAAFGNWHLAFGLNIGVPM